MSSKRSAVSLKGRAKKERKTLTIEKKMNVLYSKNTVHLITITI
jgi:hypothetical protein